MQLKRQVSDWRFNNGYEQRLIVFCNALWARTNSPRIGTVQFDERNPQPPHFSMLSARGHWLTIVRTELCDPPVNVCLNTTTLRRAEIENNQFCLSPGADAWHAVLSSTHVA
jgi:hypothetical protein